jgi:cell division protein FtsN
MLIGIVIGLLLGLAIALGVAIYLNKGAGPFASRAKPPEPLPGAKVDAQKPTAKADEPVAKAAEKPRFDFYSILPGADDAAKDKAAKDAPKAPPTDTFFLQAGAFSGAADADNMKARLAMLGVEASVQSSATADNRGPLHRVRVGPFTRIEELNRVRDRLKQNGIETTLIKGRESSAN